MTAILAIALTLAAAPALAQQNNPVAVLQSDAPFLEKAEACRTLARDGGREAVPALAALLTDEKLSHMARLALEPMPDRQAGKALRDALETTSGRIKVGIIHSLGNREDTKAVPAFVALLSGDDPELAQAAAGALGMIATPKATKALVEALDQPKVSARNLRAYCDALFDVTEALTEKGKDRQAADIYDRLIDSTKAPPQIRAAALRGAVLTRGSEKGMPLLLAALRGEDADQFAVALRIATELDEGDATTASLAEALPTLSADRKIQFIQALGHRANAEAGPALLLEANEGGTEVRVAALRALARISYSPALKLMGRLACSDDKVLADVAGDLLSYFPGQDGDDAIRAMLKDKNAETRRVAAGLIGQGALDDPSGLLMNVAKTDADEGVRVAALKSLADCAGMTEMSGLLDCLSGADTESEMRAAEKALGGLCARQKIISTGKIVIKKAVYGDLPDGASADVTKKLTRMVNSGLTSIEASNGNFGDAAPGEVKKLQVTYTYNGAPATQTVREKETLILASVSTPPEIVDVFCSAVEEAQGDAKLAVLRLLGATGSQKALDVIQGVASKDKGKAKDTALRALCNWPSPNALPAILELVKTSPDNTIKVLAMRGTVRLLRKSGIDTPELLDAYAILMGQADTAGKKRLVLGGLAQVPHPEALAMALSKIGDKSVKAEAVQAAVSIANDLGKSAQRDKHFFNGKSLAGWRGNMEYWKVEDTAIASRGDKEIPRNEFLWSDVEVRDFYLVVDVKLEPNSSNAGIQFRSKSIDDHGQALGYQADVGEGFWGRLYHEHGRGKLDWTDAAEKAVKPGEWNRYEILAVGPAIWTAINGKLGAAYLDLSEDAESSGQIAVQIHSGPPQNVRYRIDKLVHNPKVELAGMAAEELIAELKQ